MSKLCFVVGPIGNEESEERIHADWLLEGIIAPVLAEFSGFIIGRADKDARPGLIDAQLIERLLTADLVIADLSLLNPNVFYEIGIRHMTQKPIIHMQLATERPPFDVSLYRAIKFLRRKPSDLTAARAELKRSIQAVLADGYEVVNPVTSVRGRMKLEEHATSEQRVLLDQIKAIQERLDGLEIRDSVVRALLTPAPWGSSGRNALAPATLNALSRSNSNATLGPGILSGLVNDPPKTVERGTSRKGEE
jgi:hypothetical protein